MSEYRIPSEFYFRLHHIRPRFKGSEENVLFFVAEEIAEIGERPKREFASLLNSALRQFPGNDLIAEKTINNWRTEISALFGFIETDEGYSKPGRRAIELAKHRDLIEFFKIFLFNFQYPGAHNKPNEVLEQINAGIRFKPAKYICELLRYANQSGGNIIGLTKEEICHCIFNDLRVTRDQEGVARTWNRIARNRKLNLTYDSTGDVIRYAGDIVDYMEIADLLTTYDKKTYYLNINANTIIDKFCKSTEWFTEYDGMIRIRTGSLKAVTQITKNWFSYVNRDMKTNDFATNVKSFLKENPFLNDSNDAYTPNCDDTMLATQYNPLKPVPIPKNNTQTPEIINFPTTKDIGDAGENLVYAHECNRLKLCGRADLVHLIKHIPTELAAGYDIASVEADEKKRYIEVKTTISSSPLTFNRIHLTRNEWNAAETLRDRYYIYRVMISKRTNKLFLLQDPVGKYKTSQLDMSPTDGADITFNSDCVGKFEELLV